VVRGRADHIDPAGLSVRRSVATSVLPVGGCSRCLRRSSPDWRQSGLVELIDDAPIGVTTLSRSVRMWARHLRLQRALTEGNRPRKGSTTPVTVNIPIGEAADKEPQTRDSV
jgi:hypothetical protein